MNSAVRQWGESEAELCGRFLEVSFLAFAVSGLVRLEAAFDVGETVTHGPVVEDCEFTGGRDGGGGGVGASLEAAVEAAKGEVATFADALRSEPEDLSGRGLGSAAGAALSFAGLVF